MIHYVYANRSNAGDWLSALSIQSLLRAALSTSSTPSAPEAGAFPCREHLCDTPFVPDTIAELNHAGPDDFIVIGGGGLFMDYFVPFWEAFRQAPARVPFAIWGVGFCDWKRESSRPPQVLISEIVRRSRLCVVRDELTRQALPGCTLPPPVICPSFVALESFLEQETAPAERTARRVLHVDNYDAVGPTVYERMVAAAQDFAQRTGAVYSQTNNLIPAGSHAALEKLLRLYISADVVISSRLHGCILALAAGKPLVAVAGDRKIDSFMSAMGLTEWVCPPEDVHRLREMLAMLSAQGRPTRQLQEGREQNRRVAARIAAMVPGFLAPQTQRAPTIDLGQQSLSS